ncbi:MAG: calcium/proton exchanger [Methylococcaceae bacterium]
MRNLITHYMGLENPILAGMLLFLPAAFILNSIEAHPMLTFVVSGLAIVPLAAMIAHATENLAKVVGSSLGGLLNATFGNATEMVVSIVALNQGLVEVVKASISGAIIANLLLALGAGMTLGGLKYPVQEFQTHAARINASSLILALIVLLTPASIHYTSDGLEPSTLIRFSLVASGLLLMFYLLSLFFSMKTHKHLYEMDEGSEEEDTHALPPSVKSNTALLLGASIVLVFVSEILVDNLQTAINTVGLSPLFTGVILIPLFGGTVEYITVIRFARKNKMDLAVSVAMGSSLQIVLLVAPILVFTGYLMGHPMSLEFGPFELMAMAVAVLVSNMISSDGNSNWLEGVLMLVAYSILATAFYFHP